MTSFYTFLEMCDNCTVGCRFSSFDILLSIETKTIILHSKIANQVKEAIEVSYYHLLNTCIIKSILNRAL